jgi:hypothetical protein
MAAGSDASSCGNAARTRSTVAMMFAPGLRKTTTRTAGLPLARPPERMSSTESCTSATSDRRNGAPFCQATMIGRYCSATWSWSSVSICRTLSPVTSRPVGRRTFVAASVCRTSSSPTLCRLSACGFSSTRTAGSELPPTNTWPTPSTRDSRCCMMLDAASYICPVSMLSEVSAMMTMGASAGFTLR